MFKENEHNKTEETKEGELTISEGEKFKFLFKDSVYVSMFLSASLVFGLLPALGLSVSPIVTAWGLQEVISVISHSSGSFSERLDLRQE